MASTVRHRVGPARLAHAGVLLGYAALAVAMTWPLALRIGTAVPHDLFDPVGFVWVVWWNAQAVPLTARWLNAPIFYPSRGAIVFQDSLIGVWPFTTGVQWLGASPLAAHNLLLIGSFAASAFAAYVLCRRLVPDRRAAVAGGLVFGFAPYRMAQLPHVNILLTFWLPLMLLGLHEYLATRRWRWLALAGACWALQALTSGYFLVYGTVLVGLWAVFFLRSRVRDHARLALAFVLGLAAIWPWLSVYRSVHEQYGFRRSVGEAQRWAADVTSLVKAPELLAVWGRWLGNPTGEDQFFPGVTLVCACALAIAGSRYWTRGGLSRATKILLGLATAFALAAAIAAFAPASFDAMGIRIALRRPDRPLSWVWLCLLLAFFASHLVRQVIRDRSVAGFYALAALVLWLFTLGPAVRVMGQQVWHKAPYSWLLVFPGSEAVRVPARFWVLVVLALSVVVAHGLSRFCRQAPRWAWPVTGAVCVGLVAEAWPARLPLLDPPERVAVLERRPEPTTVLELPLGSPERDLAAMYRSMFHGAPTVNGYSAYEPASFTSLRVGLDDGQASALLPYSEVTALDVLVHTAAPKAAQCEELVKAAGGLLVTSGDGHTLYHLAKRARLAESAPSPPVDIARVADANRRDVTAWLTDDDASSFVVTPAVDVTLARRCQVDEVELAADPGLIQVTVRGNAGGRWQLLWSGPVAEQSVRGALSEPKAPRLRFRFTPTDVERLRIELRVPDVAATTALRRVRVFADRCG